MFMDLHRSQGFAALVVSLSFFVIVIVFMLIATRHEKKHQASNKPDDH